MWMSDLRRLRGLVDAAGYDGPIEVEILNPAIWDLPRAELMRTVTERFESGAWSEGSLENGRCALCGAAVDASGRTR